MQIRRTVGLDCMMVVHYGLGSSKVTKIYRKIQALEEVVGKGKMEDSYIPTFCRASIVRDYTNLSNLRAVEMHQRAVRLHTYARN